MALLLKSCIVRSNALRFKCGYVFAVFAPDEITTLSENIGKARFLVSLIYHYIVSEISGGLSSLGLSSHDIPWRVVRLSES